MGTIIGQGRGRGKGGGVSPEDLDGYVKEVPDPEIVSSEVVDTNVMEEESYYTIGIASNGKTYFCSNGGIGSGIKVLNDATGEIEDTNVTSGYSTMGIASNGKTYFWDGNFGGIKVLNEETGEIEDTNVTSYTNYTMVIASDGKTYFCGSYGIKVLNDATGEIEDTNITSGIYEAIGIASNGKTYFCGEGIKVLNDATGVIEGTNITSGYYKFFGMASNGKTYFGKSHDGIKVLNDTTGEIEDTNITSYDYDFIGIASDGKTYFCNTNNGGIKVLNNTTGEIENTNITSGNYYAIDIASNGKTYFCSTSGYGIKVLNDATGVIEGTNITSGYYKFFGMASNGKTYFGSINGNGIKVLNDETGVIESTNVTNGDYDLLIIASDGKTYFAGSGIKVLNDATGEIEDTNVTNSLTYNSLGIASDGKTYFCGYYGIQVLKHTYSNEIFGRKHGEWLPLNILTPEDLANAIEEHNESATAHEDIRDAMDGKVNVSDIVDNLASNDSAKPLSAKQGKEIKVMVDAANGSGGFIAPYDFGSVTPTQQALTDYAMDYIFGEDAPDHDPAEIFNGTKVQNLKDFRVWQLANTPNTTPAVFEWEPALVISEAQRNFTANPVVTNEITDGAATAAKIADNAATDAKIGNRTLTDAAASSALPATGLLTTILQTVRNCLKWLVGQFDISTGHYHNGTDSRKIKYFDITSAPPQAAYSLDEVNTGFFWINGYPIYRKVFPHASRSYPESKTTINNVTAPAGMTQVIDGYFTSTAKLLRPLIVEADGTSIAVYCRSVTSTGDGYFVLEYLKN
jgi:streptogramin lyase